MAQTHKERLEALSIAQKKDILNVADSLGMSLIKQGRSYIWAEHDSFVITPHKNLFYWNSRQVGGGAIQLVQLIKDCSYKEAVVYLNETELKSFTDTFIPKKKFNYYVKEDQDLTDTYDYLINERQLSKETVVFFISQNVVAQGTYQDKENKHEETAIVFKHKDLEGNIKGVSFQGVKPYPVIHTGRGMLKRTYGDGFYGFHVTVGNIPAVTELSKKNPLKVIAFESPIDLMSYYELHSSKIDNAVLIAMNGLRKGMLSTYLANYLGSNIAEDKKYLLLDDMEKMSDGKTDVIEIVLAVDNDEAGKRFVANFNTSFIKVHSDLPTLEAEQTKEDWNDCLKKNKEREFTVSGEKKMNQKAIQEFIKKKDYSQLSEHLKEGISDYLDGDTFKRYLEFVSRFHDYSRKNIQLIQAQNPEATHVAGFQSWKKMERYVKKGEKAIYIFVPSIRDRKDKEGNLIRDKEGNVKKDVRYLLRPVFDANQTKGKELPKQLYDLEDDLKRPELFANMYQSLVDMSPVPVTIEPIQREGTSGYYHLEDKRIVLKEGLGQVMTIKVLLHEMAHASLHQNSTAAFGDDVYRRQEFEAESVAYVVSQYLGIDTSEYSFGYLASWTDRGRKLEELSDSLETITNQAKVLIDKIDTKLENVYTLDAPKNKFEGRVLEAKQVTSSSKVKSEDIKKDNMSKSESTSKRF